MFKTYKRVIAAVVTVLVLLSNTHPVYATNHAIKNNGLNGIYIDINGSPYASTEGIMKDLKEGCTWFASARVKELTGVYPAINGGQWWWKQSNTAGGYYGFKAVTDSAPSGKAVACYTRHVSIVEAYDGKVYTISEGGNKVLGKESEKYCQITTRTLSQIKSLGGASGSFLGFVSLGVPFSKSDTEAPVIRNALARDITDTGFEVSCIATDNIGIDKVYFPTWTVNKGQDDIIWHQGKYEGGRWKCHIKTSEHKGEKGIYITHVYAYDKAGNESSLAIKEYQVGPYAKDLNLNKTTLQLNIGETSALKAAVSPSDAVDKTVIWSSSDENVVTVTDKGKIKAVGKGTAVVTAKLKIYLLGGKNQAECAITVVEKDEPKNSNPLNPTVSVESDILASDDSKPSGEDNTSYITDPVDPASETVPEPEQEPEVKDNKSATIYAKDIYLDVSSIQMNTGDKRNIKTSIYPVNATEKTIYWSSSDVSVAVVENGTVKAIGEGEALITASLSHAFADGNWFETCMVYVNTEDPSCNSATMCTNNSDNNTENRLKEGRYKAPALICPQNISYEGDNIIMTYTNRMVFVPLGNGEYRYCGNGNVYTITVIDPATYVYIVKDAETDARKMRLYFNYIG